MIRGMDHIGIAVQNLETAIAMWQQVAGAVVEHRETVPQQRVEIVVLRVGTLKVELLRPTDDDSPVAKFLATRGEGIHHLALHCDSAQNELERAGAAGARLIDAMARPGAEQTNVGFVHPRSLGGVLLEFVEHPGTNE